LFANWSQQLREEFIERHGREATELRENHAQQYLSTFLSGVPACAAKINHLHAAHRRSQERTTSLTDPL